MTGTQQHATARGDLLAHTPKDLFIDGEWVPATGGATFEVRDPASGELLCEVADASPSDGTAALDAAVAAQASWAAHPPRERGEILRRAFEELMRRQDELAVLMTRENGKPLADARGEIAYAAEFFRWFSEEAVRIDGGYQVAPNGASRFLVMRQPVGPCLFVTPWNFPMAMGTRKIGPAIAAGCTMVIKPAHQTPLSMLALAGILKDAGLPPGVLNVVPATDAGGVVEPLIRDPRARKISFTGSTAVGRRLIEQSAQQVLRVSMELGGNAPFVVFDDADLDAAVDGAMTAKMRNMGEACTAANRIYAQRGVAEEFGRRLAERMSALRLGPGVEDSTQVGPLIDARAQEKVRTLVRDAVDRGARVVVGGDVPTDERLRGGHFFTPTVLQDVPWEARMSSEEIFGPVAPISAFDTEEEALSAANNTEYGLVSYVYTRDLARGLRMAEGLETGMVGLNQGLVSNPAAPFGGIKHSGVGREGGHTGIDEFLETKLVNIGF
ncbi:NAD-dependent succinate-semialdehyde dehydrogenase [Actinoalloteichus sp. AHMU CJ021]|uniref:Succinate semialdehyde dehydrogenase n=1 Tax=Actinoalloteichus caeruleus DSM 43889 TaxID=1120930 RepID=A0ABT1JBV1_ACTCY|nr:NAD-dependent succinate-semialdehyde dehydrogenase [Actinoalloteichus caeruleus]AUS80598.1 NAD-dependent succinate-semialdehyde dehydrogenase [Actinoalloteichus sp. AHMU CJ021]MCP2329977.1 succinate semialdehyde dehydrogenase (EC 1.2.1.16) [Actinoalloteichus caeruleus DSM 43889]